MSVAAFAGMWVDKHRARRDGHRVRERQLLGAAVVGGSPGIAAGMLVFRHKTRRGSFKKRLVVIVAVQVAIGLLLAGLFVCGSTDPGGLCWAPSVV